MPNPANDAASKTLAAVKSGKAAVMGLSGVFDRLAREHGEATALIRRMSSAELGARRDLYLELRTELLSHERAELSEIYPALAGHEATRDMVAAHARDVRTLESLFAELDRLDFAEPAWRPTFERLLDCVERHIAEEENKYFPAAQNALGAEGAEALDSRFSQAKDSERARIEEPARAR